MFRHVMSHPIAYLHKPHLLYENDYFYNNGTYYVYATQRVVDTLVYSCNVDTRRPFQSHSRPFLLYV
jgi:hypothetical protein